MKSPDFSGFCETSPSTSLAVRAFIDALDSHRLFSNFCRTFALWRCVGKRNPRKILTRNTLQDGHIASPKYWSAKLWIAEAGRRTVIRLMQRATGCFGPSRQDGLAKLCVV
jgi:hypothetical protein